MEVLGVGPFEILIILVLALVVLGPQDMVKTAYRMGRAINKLIRSPFWRTMMNLNTQIRDIPTRIVRETGLQQPLGEIRNMGKQAMQDLNQTTSVITEEANALRQDINAPLPVAPWVPEINPVELSPEIAPDLSAFALLPEFPQVPLPPPAAPAIPADLPAFNLQPTYRRN
jgi:sec-independent protein translocase protein TatB